MQALDGSRLVHVACRLEMAAGSRMSGASTRCKLEIRKCMCTVGWMQDCRTQAAYVASVGVGLLYKKEENEIPYFRLRYCA